MENSAIARDKKESIRLPHVFREIFTHRIKIFYTLRSNSKENQYVNIVSIQNVEVILSYAKPIRCIYRTVFDASIGHCFT